MALFHTNRPGKLDIAIERKSDWAMTVLIEQPLGTPVNITGMTFDCDFVFSAGAPAVISPTITVLDAPGGKLKLSLTTTETASLNPGGSMYYDLWLLTANGNRPILRGSVRIVDEYSTW